jgi:hypothetical protein
MVMKKLNRKIATAAGKSLGSNTADREKKILFPAVGIQYAMPAVLDSITLTFRHQRTNVELFKNIQLCNIVRVRRRLFAGLDKIQKRGNGNISTVYSRLTKSCDVRLISFITGCGILIYRYFFQNFKIQEILCRYSQAFRLGKPHASVNGLLEII